MAQALCPNCRAQVLPRAKNPSFPFCGARCRAVDLGRWLGEEYSLPVESEEAPSEADFDEE